MGNELVTPPFEAPSGPKHWHRIWLRPDGSLLFEAVADGTAVQWGQLRLRVRLDPTGSDHLWVHRDGDCLRPRAGRARPHPDVPLHAGG